MTRRREEVAVFLVVAPALAGKVVPPEGTWAVGSRVLTVGKKGKTLAVDGGDPEPAKLVAPGLLQTASGTFQPFAVDGDRVWFADVVLTGDELVTAYGEWYHRTGGEFVGQNESSTSPEQLVVEEGVLVVNGAPLYARSERVSTSTTIRAVRGADAEAARRAARTVFVDDGIRRSLEAAQGEWPPLVMGELASLAGDQWRHTNGETYTAEPLSPCHVDLVAADGSSWPRAFWSDGERALIQRAARTSGAEGWVCEDDVLLHYAAGACESFRFLQAAAGEVGSWEASSGECVGTVEAPASSRGDLPSGDVPGVFGDEPQVRVSPALLKQVSAPADLADQLTDGGGAPLPPEEASALASSVRSAIAACSVGRAFDGRVILQASEGGFTFWRVSPATTEGQQLVDCAEAGVQRDGPPLSLRSSVAIGVKTSRAPTRAEVAVRAYGEVAPELLARVTDAAAACAAEFPLEGPYTQSFQPQDGLLLGATVAMAEGQVMPSSGFSECLWFPATDFPAGSTQFDFGPK